MNNTNDEVFIYRALTNLGTGFTTGYATINDEGLELVEVLLDGYEEPIALAPHMIISEELN